MTPSLTTRAPRVILLPLTETEAAEYRELLHRNALHLGADYAAELDRTEAEIAEELGPPTDPSLRFGVRASGTLIGRIDLVPVDPPRYGMGYWVSEERTGEGIASAAVDAMVRHAGRRVGATDIFAGVSHGNRASERVLEKNGFARVESFERYDRFRRTVGAGART